MSLFMPKFVVPKLTDHGSEIGLLTVIAMGVMILMGWNHHDALDAGKDFDPSAYLVVLTLIVGAIKERWLSRSVDRMGQIVGNSQPANDNPAGTQDDPFSIQGTSDDAAEPVHTKAAKK